MSEPIAVEVASEGHEVWVECSLGSDFITAQEAYELHQALGAVLPELVQPFTAVEPRKAESAPAGAPLPTVSRQDSTAGESQPPKQ